MTRSERSKVCRCNRPGSRVEEAAAVVALRLNSSEFMAVDYRWEEGWWLRIIDVIAWFLEKTRTHEDGGWNEVLCLRPLEIREL